MSARGLVSSSTSGKPLGSRVPIDAKTSRCRRLRRSVKWAAHLHSQPRRGQRLRAWMVTLTYADVDGWHARHVSDYLRRMRQWLAVHAGGPLRYTWVAELQKRGAVHYHVLVWLPARLACPKPDKAGWWRHGMSQRVLSHSPIGYLVKYASKFDSVGEFPKGLRLHGSGGFDPEGREYRHWLALPGWLRQQVGVGIRIDRPAGGGFVVRGTGEWLPSPWRFCHSAGGGSAYELFRYADPVPATGPYSLLGDPSFKRIEVTPS